MWDYITEGLYPFVMPPFVMPLQLHCSAITVQGPCACNDGPLRCCDSVLQEENVGSAISFALGINRARHIQLVSIWDGDVDNDHPSSPTSSLAAEAAKAQAKVRIWSMAATLLSVLTHAMHV